MRALASQLQLRIAYAMEAWVRAEFVALKWGSLCTLNRLTSPPIDAGDDGITVLRSCETAFAAAAAENG